MFRKQQLKMTLYFTFILIGTMFLLNAAIYLLFTTYDKHQRALDVAHLTDSINESEWLSEGDMEDEEHEREEEEEDDDEHEREVRLPSSEEIIIPYNILRFDLYAVYDNAGRLVAAKADEDLLPDSIERARTSLGQEGGPAVLVLQGEEERHYMAARRSIVVDGEVLGSYMAGMDISQDYAIMDTLLCIMLYGMLAGSVVSIAVGYAVAGRAIRPIKEAYESKERFAADASHELRTPVSVIMLSAEAIEREMEAGSPYVKKAVANIKKEARKMGNLVESLLFLARSDQQDFSLAQECVDMGEILEKNAETFGALAEQKDISLETQAEGDLRVNGDARLLSVLVSILLDNAIKYNREGGWVSLRGEKVAHGKGAIVQVTVEDNGIGIAETDLPRIFDRFYRPDKSRSSSTGGHGLGLSIAREIAIKHGGFLRVESTQGQGTRLIAAFKEYSQDPTQWRRNAL